MKRGLTKVSDVTVSCHVCVADQGLSWPQAVAGAEPGDASAVHSRCHHGVTVCQHSELLAWQVEPMPWHGDCAKDGGVLQDRDYVLCFWFK